MALEILCLMYYVSASVVALARQINLGQTGRNDNNTITIQCTDINDEPVHNAVFYRNSAPLKDDPCFKGRMAPKVVSDAQITITVSPPCEGYFSCGRERGTMISLPVPIYGTYNVWRSLHEE